MVSRKAGRETNPLGLEQIMDLFDRFVIVANFGSYFGALKGGPKIDHQTNKSKTTQKNEVQETGLNTYVFKVFF